MEVLAESIEQALKRMSENWPSEFIARGKIEDFTGGMMTGKSVANLESKGEGPDGSIKCGGKAGYIKGPFIDWLRPRLSNKR